MQATRFYVRVVMYVRVDKGMIKRKLADREVCFWEILADNLSGVDCVCKADGDIFAAIDEKDKEPDEQDPWEVTVVLADQTYSIRDVQQAAQTPSVSGRTGGLDGVLGEPVASADIRCKVKFWATTKPRATTEQ